MVRRGLPRGVALSSAVAKDILENTGARLWIQIRLFERVHPEAVVFSGGVAPVFAWCTAADDEDGDDVAERWPTW